MDYYLEKLQEKEKKQLRKGALSRAMAVLGKEPLENIKNKIPQGLRSALTNAFTLGFSLVFEKGTGVILAMDKKTLADLSSRRYANEAELQKRFSSVALERFGKDAKVSGAKNALLSTAQGALMGLMGMGIPDAVVLIAMMLKSVYEIAESYGFGVKNIEEKYFILSLFDLAFCPEEEKMAKSRECDSIFLSIERREDLVMNFEEKKYSVASSLCEGMLLAKFIQGLPVVGVVGGLANFPYMASIAKVAHLKYEKRMVMKQRALL